jgi:hypothetical protein
MPGRRYNPANVDAALNQRFESLSNYRRQLIEEGGQRLTQTLESFEGSEVFMPEVRATPSQQQQLLDMAAQQGRGAQQGSSLASRLEATRRSKQLVLQALENPEQTRQMLSSFYNPITGKRESISTTDSSQFFTVSLPEYEENLKSQLRTNIQTQMEPYLSEFDTVRNQLLQQRAEADEGAVFGIDEQLRQLERERLGAMSGVLKDVFGTSFDFTDLQGRDASYLQQITGYSVPEYLARTQDELIDIFGEERLQEETERRQMLSRRFEESRGLAMEQARRVNEQNKEIEAQNVASLEEATEMRREASQQQDELRRNRRKSLDFGSGLSLDFGDRPL